ncbi:hypothetical protein EV13_2047 [Prochlorococcus sp. MIT 0702]|nr:hypothetical protein EV13_2047 [Prochlorococcus sp. MIT 0702]KGG28205.1 hypothetical protein EV12_0955 [Prochlorococcus sp. MIT 0701]KGG37256.1 hypothetical protein EV14_0048 [Prochlorococcus sp. MIT 0703]
MRPEISQGFLHALQRSFSKQVAQAYCQSIANSPNDLTMPY